MGYQWLGNKEKGRVGENVRVSLGRDPRLSGASLSVAVFSGLDRADDSITLAIHFVMGSNFFTRRGGLTSRRWRRFAVKLRLILELFSTTDVDRSGVVDKEGNPINGDRLIALMSAIVLREHPGTTIVTDARTSMALTRFIIDRGGQHCLYRVGYRNVIDKGVQLNKNGIETHLMMETSGHGALKENYFLDDGAYMVVKIIIEMVRMKLAGSDEGIGSLMKDLEEPLESVELRMNIISEPRHAKARGMDAIETFRSFVEEGRIEGWELDSCGDCWVADGCLVDSNDDPAAVDAHMYRAKVSDEKLGQHGWIHLRQSIHNPNIAVNMQSMAPGGCLSMAKTLRDKFLVASGMDKILDITQIDKYARTGLVK
ncbi:hypothetical protein D5086_016577 [Populus alba]|uniref:Uncharacterized protein n=1 Tax=Populus alba TaxID=43335 RepID=A0ACC4BUH7_POPAL